VLVTVPSVIGPVNVRERAFAALLLAAGPGIVACAGASADSRQGTRDTGANGGSGHGGATASSGGASIGTGGGARVAGGAAGCAGGGCVATGGAVAARPGGATGSGGFASTGGAPSSGGARPKDGGVPVCRLDLCTISSNCCAPDGTCGNDSGEGCTSNGFRPPACDVTVEVVTITVNGTFAPHNVGAIWVQTPSGAFEKTLYTWGGPSLPRATNWLAVSGGNKVDAVSSATRPGHGPLSASWNCTDASEAVVPDGSYDVCITFAESNCIPQMASCAGPIECVTFMKGTSASTVTAPDTANFSSFVIRYR
jgi:hypothetical protein